MSYSAAFSQAIEIMIYIATKTEEENLSYLSIQKISDTLNIPIPSVKRLISFLKRENLISSKTGISGGLAVSRPINTITLYDVFIAIEGSNPLFKIHSDFDVTAFQRGEEVSSWLLNGIKAMKKSENALLQNLKETNLDDLLRT
jgi:Rrf2 family protein